MDDVTNYRLLWMQWGWRGYIGMFIALGLTALGKAVPGLRSVVLALTVLDMVAVFWMGGLFFKYRRFERKARQRHS